MASWSLMPVVSLLLAPKPRPGRPETFIVRIAMERFYRNIVVSQLVNVVTIDGILPSTYSNARGAVEARIFSFTLDYSLYLEKEIAYVQDNTTLVHQSRI